MLIDSYITVPGLLGKQMEMQTSTVFFMKKKCFEFWWIIMTKYLFADFIHESWDEVKGCLSENVLELSKANVL